MPWKVSETMSLRSEFVVLADNEGSNLAELCRRFGISRKSGYKWIGRFSQAGVAGRFRKSRPTVCCCAPSRSPASRCMPIKNTGPICSKNPNRHINLIAPSSYWSLFNPLNINTICKKAARWYFHGPPTVILYSTCMLTQKEWSRKKACRVMSKLREGAVPGYTMLISRAYTAGSGKIKVLTKSPSGSKVPASTSAQWSFEMVAALIEI